MLTEEEKKKRAREAKRRWRENNRGYIREYGREHYHKNRERILERCKKRVLTPEQKERKREYGREYQRKYYPEHREAILEKKRGRKQSKEYQQEYWRKNNERLLKKKMMHRRDHPERYRARDSAKTAVANALANGKLKRPKRCEKCDYRGPVESHHYLGYAREHRLDVQWLCKSCHRIDDAKDGYSK